LTRKSVIYYYGAIPGNRGQRFRLMPLNFPEKPRDLLLAVALASLVLVLGYWRMVPEVCGDFHDDAIYVITAKALAQGEGYRLLYLPGAPLQTKYPFLYPALLAVIWKFWPTFPDNLALMKWLSLLCGAATVALSYLYFIRFHYLPRTMAFAPGLICATSPFFLYFATQTLSELPFALLVVLAIWVFDARLGEPPAAGRRQFFLGALLALPFLCRTLGLTLPLAGLLILYHRGRSLRWTALGAMACMLPWILWMIMGLGAWSRDPISGYYTDYLSWWLSTGWAFLFRIAADNFLNILWSVALVSMEGITVGLQSFNSSIVAVFFLFIGSIPVVALVTKIPGWQLLPFFLISYLAIVLLWPWQPIRFMVPIMPFLLAYFVQAVNWLVRRCSGKVLSRYLLPLGLSLVLGANLVLLYQHGQMSRKYGYPYIRLVPQPASWASYKGIFQWLRTHSQRDDLVASAVDPMMFLYAERRAIRPFKIGPAVLGYGEDLESYGSAEDLAQVLRGYKVSFLVKVPVFAFNQERLDGLFVELQQKYPGWLTRVYADKDERFAVFALAGDPSGGSSH
jgi:hypothetical protein